MCKEPSGEHDGHGSKESLINGQKPLLDFHRVDLLVMANWPDNEHYEGKYDSAASKVRDKATNGPT